MPLPRPPRPRETLRRNAIFRGYSNGLAALFSPAVIMRRNALQRGLIGGSKGWLALFVAISARSFLKKHVGRQMEVVSTEVLTKGQAVSVRSIPPLTRRQRRALRSR
jgi:hypothetical protein